MEYSICKANPKDAQKLSEIAWQSKSHWNYPIEWMELWRKELTISRKLIEANKVFKLVLDQIKIIGFCVLINEEDILWVEHLWILPAYIGNGLGRKLLQVSLEQTNTKIPQKIRVVSDINAKLFYQKMGFTTIGQYESVPKGRLLPLMEKPFL